MNAFEYYRKKSGLSQQEVATKLGLDQTAVSAWEKSKKMPRAERMPSIAALFQCSIDDLYKKF